MQRINGVIFDMDGLMFDSETYYYAAAQKAADELQMPYNKAYYCRYIGTSDAYLHHAYLRDFGDADLVARFEKRAHRYFAEATEHELTPKPGLFELLAYLEQEEIPAVVASSNNRPAIQHFLKINKLLKRLPLIVSGDDVQEAKPDPEVFNRAAELLKRPKNELLILEDSLNGVLAASSAGIPCIMVPDLIVATPEIMRQTLAVLPDLSAVKTYLTQTR